VRAVCYGVIVRTCGFLFSSRRRHTRSKRDWSSDVCSSDLFKANIDDLRESPSKNIAVALTERLAEGTVLVVEPNIDALPPEFDGHANVEFAELHDAVQRADIVLLLVDHDRFRTLDREELQEKVVIDTKGLWR